MNLIDNTSFLWIASGYKSGSLFSIVPNTSAGDLTTFRSTSGSRINSGGFVELVGPGVGRLDYSTTASCPFVRLESDRTNYIYSSDLLQGGTTAWSSSSLRSFVTNSITAPNSSSNVCLVTESVGSAAQRYIVQNTGLTIAGQTATVSLFAKRYSAGSNRNLYINTLSGYGATVYFTLEGTGSWYAETATTAKTNIAYVSGAMIEPVGDNWYRCSVTCYNPTSTVRLRAGLFSGSVSSTTKFDDVNTTGINYSGNGDSGLYLWGAQVESGSAHGARLFPSAVSNSLVSAYISSSTTSLGSRTADRMISFPTSSSPTNFTVYTVLKTNAEDTSGGINLALQSGSSIFSGFGFVGWYKGTVPLWNTGSGGDSSTLQGSTATALAAGAEHKLAIRYSASLATWFRNGVMLGSQSFPLAYPSWSYFTLGGFGNNTVTVTNPYTQYFRTVAVIDRGLTDVEAIQLTT